MSVIAQISSDLLAFKLCEIFDVDNVYKMCGYFYIYHIVFFAHFLKRSKSNKPEFNFF